MTSQISARRLSQRVNPKEYTGGVQRATAGGDTETDGKAAEVGGCESWMRSKAYAQAKWCRVYGGDLTCGSRCVEVHVERRWRVRRCNAMQRDVPVCVGRIVIVYSFLFRHAFAAPSERSCLCRYHDYIAMGVARAQKYQTTLSLLFAPPARRRRVH